MISYAIYRQLDPKRIQRPGVDEYHANLLLVGHLTARDGDEAIDEAKRRGLAFNPIVQAKGWAA